MASITGARVKTLFAVVGPLAALGAYSNSRKWKGLTQEKASALLATEAKVAELELNLKETQEQLRVNLEVADRQDRLANIERQLESGAEKGWETGMFLTFFSSTIALAILGLSRLR